MTFLNLAFKKLSLTSTVKHYIPMACKVQMEEYCVYLIRCVKNAFHEAGTFRCPPSAENEATTCPTVHVTGNKESQKEEEEAVILYLLDCKTLQLNDSSVLEFLVVWQGRKESLERVRVIPSFMTEKMTPLPLLSFLCQIIKPNINGTRWG